jgi:antitoxin (DNA-binding transcriptional repressor) of toxin-antitoxin stability system
MTSVAIKELAERIDEYVGRAREGERFMVIDGGEPVAELAPLSPERVALLKAAAAGELAWSGGKPEGLRGIFVRGEPVSETVIRNRR